MRDDIDIIDSDGLDWDIAMDYRDDVGVYQWCITWWGRMYLGAIFPTNFPRGNPRPWRQIGDKEEPNTSKGPSEEGTNDQDYDTRKQRVRSVGEGGQDGDDEEDGEDEEDEKDKEDERDKEEEDEEVEEDESNAVPHHFRDDAIALGPQSISSCVEKYPTRDLDSSPHPPMPIVWRQYKCREPNESQSQEVSFHDLYQ